MSFRMICAVAITPKQAKEKERQFIASARAGLAGVGRVFNPMSGNQISYKAGDISIVPSNERDVVKFTMDRKKVFDRDLLHSMPENAMFRCMIRDKKNRSDVIIYVVCISPVEELIENQLATKPAGPADVVRIVNRLAEIAGHFHFVGIMSTTSWSEEALGGDFDRENVRVALFSPNEFGGFDAVFRDLNRGEEIFMAFSNEAREQKLERIVKMLAQNARLKVKGGFVVLDEFASNNRTTPELTLKAANQLLKNDAELALEEVDNTKILRRKRI